MFILDMLADSVGVNTCTDFVRQFLGCQKRVKSPRIPEKLILILLIKKILLLMTILQSEN